MIWLEIKEDEEGTHTGSKGGVDDKLINGDWEIPGDDLWGFCETLDVNGGMLRNAGENRG